jgi:hypothetical protein
MKLIGEEPKPNLRWFYTYLLCLLRFSSGDTEPGTENWNEMIPISIAWHRQATHTFEAMRRCDS